MYECMYHVGIEKARQRVGENERQSEKTMYLCVCVYVCAYTRRCRGLCENGTHSRAAATKTYPTYSEREICMYVSC